MNCKELKKRGFSFLAQQLPIVHNMFYYRLVMSLRINFSIYSIHPAGSVTIQDMYKTIEKEIYGDFSSPVK